MSEKISLDSSDFNYKTQIMLLWLKRISAHHVLLLA